MLRSMLRKLSKVRSTTARRPSRALTRRPILEALEDRLVLSTLSVSNGVLTYTAGAGIANNLTVALNGATYTFTDTAETISAPGRTGNGTNTVSVPANLVTSMTLNMGDKADLVRIQSTANAITVNAGLDDDQVSLGNASNSLDQIQAQVRVNGEAGSDKVFFNDQGASGAKTYTVTGSSLSRTGAAAMSFSATETVVVNGGGAFFVRSTAAGTNTILNAGFGNDSVSLGSLANSLDPLAGAVTFNGSLGSDTISVLDQGTLVGKTYTLTSDSLARSGAGLISFSGSEQLVVQATAGNDTFAVQSTTASMPVTVALGAGADKMVVGSATNSLDSIQGALNATGGAGGDTLTLADQGTATGQTYTIASVGVSRSGAATVSYSGMEGLVVNGSAGDDTIAVQSTLATTPVTVNAGPGSDTVNVGRLRLVSLFPFQFLPTLDGIQGALTVNGQDGSDRLTLQDTGTAAGQTYTMSATSVARSGVAAITFGTVEDLAVSAGKFADTFNVRGTAAGTTTTVDAGLGSDTFTVGSAGLLTRLVFPPLPLPLPTLDAIQGPVSLNGQGGADTLTVLDTGASVGQTFTITDSSVARSGAGTISYSAMTSLTVSTGNGNDVITVASTNANTPTFVNARGGNDVINVGGGNLFFTSVAGIQGALHIDAGTGADALNYNDPGSRLVLPINPAGQSYSVFSSDIARSGVALVSYLGLESLTLNTGGGDDTIRIQSSLATTSIVVNAGLGDDRVILGAGGSVRNLLGPVTLNGQGGSDTLDYGDFDTAVQVNLVAGTATKTTGISGFENAVGGFGNDILVGDANANALSGGAGRDLIIGGGGADVLFGGIGDDLIIASSTDFDLNSAALSAVLNTWSSSLGYQARINQLRSGVGLFGVFKLNDTTVHVSAANDDGVSDRLTGGVPLISDQDWFWARLSGPAADVLVDLQGNEAVN